MANLAHFKSFFHQLSCSETDCGFNNGSEISCSLKKSDQPMLNNFHDYLQGIEGRHPKRVVNEIHTNLLLELYSF